MKDPHPTDGANRMEAVADIEALGQAARSLGLPWTDAQTRGLAAYLEEMGAVSRTTSIISFSSIDELIFRHLADALPLAAALDSRAWVCDVGSGGGLPGLVVACLRPDCHVDLLETKTRKHAVLARLVAVMGCGNARAVRGRFPEAVAQETTDLVSRAVFPPRDWIQLAQEHAGGARSIWSMLSGRQYEALTGRTVHVWTEQPSTETTWDTALGTAALVILPAARAQVPPGTEPQDLNPNPEAWRLKPPTFYRLRDGRRRVLLHHEAIR